MEGGVGRRCEAEVKTIWSEMVKPSNPTPSHLNTLKLSFPDQMWVTPSYLPVVLFYSAPSSAASSSPSSSSDLDGMMMKMKTSLSKALSQFYPLAGRLLDESTLSCEDQGVLLIHTRVTCPIQHYSSLITRYAYNNDDDDDDHHQEPPLSKLLPPPHSLHASHQTDLPIPISAWLPLAIQVNVFECGGVVIGCYMSHKLLDGISDTTFLRHWAGQCMGLGPEDLVQPNFDAIVAAFPPCDLTKLRDGGQEEELQVSTATTPTSRVTLKAFLFTSTAISAIREKAASDRVPNPTKVESVLGFLWKHFLEAEASEWAGPTNLFLTVGMRQRVHPTPLPRESMGNFSTSVVARAEKNKDLGLTDLAAEIRRAINDFKDQKMREFQGERGAVALWEYRKKIDKEARSSYKILCLCGLGFSDVDFGFGKPFRVSVYSDGVILPTFKNTIVLSDHIDLSNGQVNGIEANVILDKKQMRCLETDPDFLAMASPLYRSFG